MRFYRLFYLNSQELNDIFAIIPGFWLASPGYLLIRFATAIYSSADFELAGEQL